MSATADVRACFVGDSFVAGTGDPHYLGWAGRLSTHARAQGVALTTYNLGVRRDTSSDVAARWEPECLPRLPAGCDARIVVSFGVNDTVTEDGRIRVPADRSVHNLRQIASGIRRQGWELLVVGPPPACDGQHDELLAALDDNFRQVCAAQDVPYVSVHPLLVGDQQWADDVHAGDGIHPGAHGYDLLAAAVMPAWRRWLSLAPA